MPFSAVWSWSTILQILSSLIRVFTIYHSQQSDQGLHFLLFAAVWSRSRSTDILRNFLIRVYIICLFQPFDHDLHYFPFFLSSIIKVYTVCHSFLPVLSRSTLFAIFSCLIRVYTICHCQQSNQGLHCFPFSAVWSRSTLFAIHSLIRVYTICHSRQSDQGPHYLRFFLNSTTRSTLFAILSILIRVCTICYSQQSDQCLHCLPFSAVWSVSTLFIISVISVYTICHSQQSDQDLHYFPFFLSSIITVYTIRHSQQSDQSTQQSHKGQGPHCHFQEDSDQGLHYLQFSALWSRSRSTVWSGSTIFAILSHLIMVYTISRCF